MDTSETISFCCLLGQLVRAPLFVFFFFLSSNSRIVSHSPFVCKWQNKFQDSEPVAAHFLSNKSGTSDIRISRSSSKFHPAPCMRDVRRVHGLGPSHMSKQNVLSLILLISLAKLMNQKRGICGHRILYPLQLRPSFPDNARTLRPKAKSDIKLT